MNSFREEFRKAAERRNSLPPYARPTVTRPMFPAVPVTAPLPPDPADATARRLAWFTDDELTAELRRRALAGEVTPTP